MLDMSSTTEIFENEEATKLLDYFVAYKKMMRTIEQIKCIAAVNKEIHFSENLPTQKNELDQTDNIQLTSVMAMALDK